MNRTAWLLYLLIAVSLVALAMATQRGWPWAAVYAVSWIGGSALLGRWARARGEHVAGLADAPIYFQSILVCIGLLLTYAHGQAMFAFMVASTLIGYALVLIFVLRPAPPKNDPPA